MPDTSEDRDATDVMDVAYRLVQEIRRQMPWVPEIAISRGLISLGIHLGCDSQGPHEVAAYLRGAATTIATPH